jgi:hypothetical protein
MNQDDGYLRSDVRSALYLAQEYAPPGSDVDREVQRLSAQILQ